MSGILSMLGCAGISGSAHETLKPTLQLEDYFTGEIDAWGLVQDRSGNVTSRFDISLEGKWDGATGILEEKFTFYNGKKQERTWTITRVNDKHYTGTAGDIIGSAKGIMHGNAVRWTYTMDVPVDDTSYRLTFDDWMWLMNDGVLINRSYMKKFGIVVGEITIFMKKKS